MSAGRLLTLGLGTPFSAVKYLVTLGLGTSGTPPVPVVVVADDQPSNWQANYWKHKSKADRENEEMLDRIRLGILPPEAREEADAAVRQTLQAATLQAAGRIEPAEQLRVAMEAREAYENAYRQAYGEAYIAEVVAEQWREDMKRQARRRKAILLLLH